MFEVRIHGRGGQGVVTAAEMLSVAAFLEGKHAQAFPSFGSERMGAPVVAFCRIADTEIRLREPIQAPDALIVQDPTLFKALDVTEGLKSRRLSHRQHLAHAERDPSRRDRRAPAQGPCADRAGDRTRAEICQPARAQHRAARRLRGRGRRRLARQRARGDPPRLSRQGRRSQCRGGQGRLRPHRRQGRRLNRSESRPMLHQIEGSKAMARSDRALPAASRLRLSDHAADAYRRGPGRTRALRRSRQLRVHQRRERIRRAFGRDRRFGRRRARLYRHREPGPAVHGRGGLQRRRASACPS